MDPLEAFMDDLRDVIQVAAGVKLVYDLGPLCIILGDPQIACEAIMGEVVRQMEEVVEAGILSKDDQMLLLTHLVYEECIKALPEKPDISDGTPGPQPSEN